MRLFRRKWVTYRHGSWVVNIQQCAQCDEPGDDTMVIGTWRADDGSGPTVGVYHEACWAEVVQYVRELSEAEQPQRWLRR